MPGVGTVGINVDEFTHVPGVKLAPPGLPEWKAKMLKEKNVKIIMEYLVSGCGGVHNHLFAVYKPHI